MTIPDLLRRVLDWLSPWVPPEHDHMHIAYGAAAMLTASLLGWSLVIVALTAPVVGALVEIGQLLTVDRGRSVPWQDRVQDIMGYAVLMPLTALRAAPVLAIVGTLGLYVLLAWLRRTHPEWTA